MKYLHYTTALTGRDQAALLAITWPQTEILLDADFSRIEERVLGWMADPGAFIWYEESHYFKDNKWTRTAGITNYEGWYSGRYTK